MSVGSPEQSSPALWDTRYRILRTLGTGGMGTVWLVEDTLQPGRIVALKRHHPEFAHEIPLFLREFRIHRQLSHPHIPRAYELGFCRDKGVLCPYFTLEVSAGVGLHEILTQSGRGLSRTAVLEIAVGLVRALDHLHRQGFVHADIKPANVLVSQRDGRFHADLIDFGVAVPRGRALGDELLATPEYAAPEVLEGATVDPRSDLYAVGLILYEMLESRRPWPDSDVDKLWALRTKGGPPPLSATDVSPGLATLVTRLLSPRPQDRFGSAAELLNELARVTAYEVEVEPIEAFVQRLLTVPLPWRGWLERLAAEVTEEPLMPGAPYAAIIDIPAGFFARRLLGPVLDEAAARRARILPVRFDPRQPVDGLLQQALAEISAEERTQAHPRALVLILENIDLADEKSLALIEAVMNKTTRLVATRSDPSILPRFLGRPGPDGRLEPKPGVLTAPLPAWTDEDVRGWLHRALGRIGAPWEFRQGGETDPANTKARHSERGGLPEVATPAGLVEHLAALYREGRIVRVGDGYGWRERPGAERELNLEVEDLETLLSAIRTPVPERTINTYLAGRAADVGDLVSRGKVRPRGDGTVEVGPEYQGTYARLAPSRRKALHKRLAQALETVHAPPHRIAEEWLDSDTPLMAVPHILAAAEARPGRPWLDRSLKLIARARELLVNAQSATAPDSRQSVRLSARRTGREQRIELWRYESLVLATEARVLLATGVLESRDPAALMLDAASPVGTLRQGQIGPVERRISALAALGTEQGHRGTLRVALDLQLALAWARRDWAALVAAAESAVGLDGDGGEPGARLRWARAMRFRAEGLPEDAWTELTHGYELAQRGAGGVGSLALPLVGQVGDARLAILEARAMLASEADWGERAEASCRALGSANHGSVRASTRARAARLEALRTRHLGALDDALKRAEEAAHTLPRERVPSLDAEVELELGSVRLELGDMALALEHARFASALANDDRNRELEAKAALLESALRYYLGELGMASLRAQEAVRLAGGGVDAGATDARTTVLELALATQGKAMAQAIMREAAELAWRAQRRGEHTRAARAFRLAAEAAILRQETSLALDWSQRALSELERVGASRLIRPRIFATASRSLAVANRPDAARRLWAAARAEIMVVALAIADGEAREKWLSHPDQKALLGLSTMGVGPEARTHPRLGLRRPTPNVVEAAAAAREAQRIAVLLAPMRI